MGTVIVQRERHEALPCELDGAAALVGVQPAGLVREQQPGERAVGRVGKGDRPTNSRPAAVYATSAVSVMAGS